MGLLKKIIILTVAMTTVSNAADLKVDVPIGDCVSACEAIKVDYAGVFCKAVKGDAEALKKMMELTRAAPFDGAATTAHRLILWKLFILHQEAFQKSFTNLAKVDRILVRQRLTEALEDSLRDSDGEPQ